MKYLKRQIDKEFEAWKSSVEHKPLLVRGAGSKEGGRGGKNRAFLYRGGASD